MFLVDVDVCIVSNNINNRSLLAPYLLIHGLKGECSRNFAPVKRRLPTCVSEVTEQRTSHIRQTWHHSRVRVATDGFHGSTNRSQAGLVILRMPREDGQAKEKLCTNTTQALDQPKLQNESHFIQSTQDIQDLWPLLHMSMALVYGTPRSTSTPRAPKVCFRCNIWVD